MRAYFTILTGVILLSALALVEQKAHVPGPCPSITPAVALTPRQISYGQAEDVSRRVLVANGCSAIYAPSAGRAAVDNDLSPRIVAAVVFVESSCNPITISPQRAIGLMQINPRVWHHSAQELRDPTENVQIGTRILAGYVKSYGLQEGLHRYNGLGDESNDYSARVMSAAYRR